MTAISGNAIFKTSVQAGHIEIVYENYIQKMKSHPWTMRRADQQQQEQQQHKKNTSRNL